MARPRIETVGQAESSIPLFPLPSVVLFPGVFLPLHVFESPYRQMVGDALAGDRMIGVALLQPGYELDEDGSPPVYATGCAGLITHVERLDEGRYNIVLRGLEKFRILREVAPPAGVLYRRAVIAPVDDPFPEGDRAQLRRARTRLETLLATVLDVSLGDQMPSAMPDDDLVNALAQYLGLEPVEKQALLERHGVLDRCRSLIELLEMRALIPRTAAGSGLMH